MPQRRLNSSPLERRLERSKLYTFRLVMLAIFVFGVSYTVCLLLLPDHPGSFALGSVTDYRQIWLSQGPGVVISVSMALLSVAVLMHLRTRLISRQVDILCRQFLAYRREHEQGELEIPSKTEVRTGMELRVMMLRELWNRFQKTQEALALNLTELENSKVQLEQTVDSLKRAKAHEQRLVELGYAVAEFGHDIGNANGSILSFCTLVLKMFEKDLVSTMDLVRALTYIRRIKHSSVNISGLTGDIVEFAKGNMKLHREKMTLEQFKEQLDVQLGFVGEMKLEYHLTEQDLEVPLYFDCRKVSRVVVNLVKNSWEKLLDEEEEGLIQIRISILDQKDLQIQVYDNGGPISENIVGCLFESFKTEGKENGTGLGLAICAKLIQLHGGMIRARNLEDDSGVLFEIYLSDCVMPSLLETPSEIPVLGNQQSFPTEVSQYQVQAG